MGTPDFLGPHSPSALPNASEPSAFPPNSTVPEHHHRFAPLADPSILQIPTFVLSIFYLLVTLAVIVQIAMNLYYKCASPDSCLRRFSFSSPLKLAIACLKLSPCTRPIFLLLSALLLYLASL